MDTCVICKLIKGELPAWVVFEDEDVICFLPLEVQAYGHTVLAPKAHHQDLFDTPPAVLNCVIAAAQKLARHYQSAVGASGVNLLHASGLSAQQSVLHLHFHLIPRFEGDGLDAWPNLPETPCSKEELLQALRLESSRPVNGV